MTPSPQHESSQGLPAPDPVDRRAGIGATAEEASDSGEPASGKLIPEWKLDGDNQIIVLALIVLALIVSVGAWVVATDDDGQADPAAEQRDDRNGDGGGGDERVTDRQDAADDDQIDDRATEPAELDDDSDDAGVDGDGEADGDGAAAPSTTDLAAQVQTALAGFSAVNASVVVGDSGTTIAVLDGFVGTSEDAATATAAALAVEGIDTVDDQLTILQPDVEAALASAGVADPVVTMDDTAATIAGTVPDATTRDTAVAAAGAVPGVTAVADNLTVTEDVDQDTDGDSDRPSGDELQTLVDQAIDGLGDTAAGVQADVDGDQVTLTGIVATDTARQAVIDAVAEINGVGEVEDRLVIRSDADVARVAEINDVLEANPVRFRSSEAEILPQSFPTLDLIAEALQGPPLALRIEGYTDVLGDEEFNLELSQARADAVLEYLADSGVDTSLTEAVGLGETEQFGAGNTVEALAANRRVLFRLI